MTAQHIGPYRILSQLGRGGMGTVFLAVVEGVVPGVGVGERVALKVVHPDLVRDLDVFERFVSEAALGRRIRHDNVVRTLDAGMDFGDDGDQIYLAMEYVVGRTLASIRKEQGRLPEGMCRRVAREVARGLQGIHECGVVHGDLKPENVLVTRDEVVKVMDLGLARLRGMSMRSTGAGRFEGTFLYAAPEQFSEGTRAIDARADLYALGVSIHELLTGVHPFAHDDVRVVMHRHLHEAPPRLRDVAPEASPFLEAVVLELLAKDPSARFRSAAELLAVLARGEDSQWWQRRATTVVAPDATAGEHVGASAARESGDGEDAIALASRVHGREEELVTVLRTFDEVCEGRAGTIVVVSEPGGGKTRFVREVATILSQREPPPAVVRASTATAPDAIARSAGPTVVIVDDLARASAAEATALAGAARSLGGRPVLLLATAPAQGHCPGREALNQIGGALELPLHPLGTDALRALLDDLLDAGHAGTELLAWVTRWSDGNPRLATALMRDLRDRAALDMGADGAWRPLTPLRKASLPESVRAQVASRIELLPTEDRDFLDATACAGCAFDVEILGAAIGDERGAVAVRLGALVRQGILRSDDGEHFSFASRALHAVAHALVQEMLRPEYHRLMADAEIARAAGATSPAATSPAAAARIARHLFEAGAGADALPYVETALPRLAAGKEWDDILDLAEPALAAAAGDPERCNRLSRAAARAHLAIGRVDVAERLLMFEEETVRAPSAHTRAAGRTTRGT